MGTPGNIIVGSKVWVGDPEVTWIDGEVTEINGKSATIMTSKGRTVVAEISSIYPKDTEAPPAGVDDMTKLAYHQLAASRIQRQIRTHSTRKEFITLRNATIHIQKIWRAKLARKLYEHMRREAASVRIQKHVRAHRAIVNYTSLQASAMVIQSGLRALAARNEYRYRRVRQKMASIKIQRQWRRVLALPGYKQKRPFLLKRLFHWFWGGSEQISPEILNNFRQMSKKALLIGCNYPGTMAELRGCINDVWIMKHCLMAYLGFSRQGIIVLIDTDPSYTQPTKNNIRSHLSLLVESAEPGDELFVHFSGHGERLPSKNKDDDTGYDEYIISTDGKRITDDDFRAVAALVPEGCRMTIVADCCHSGGLIEGAKEQIGDSTKIRRQHSRSGFVFEEFENFHNEQYAYVMDRSMRPPNPIEDDDGFEMLEPGESSGILGHQVEANAGSTESSISVDRGILLSACQSYQKAKEGRLRRNSDKVFGIFTDAIVGIIRETRGRITNRELVLRARDEIMDRRFPQRPGLYCSDLHGDASFLGADLI